MLIHHRQFKLIVAILLIVSIAATLVGVNKFYLWHQITSYYHLDLPVHQNFWNSVLEPSVANEQHIHHASILSPVANSHTPRYLLMLPVVIVAEQFTINPNLVFSIVVTGLIFFAWSLLIHATRRIAKQVNYSAELVLLITLMVASLTVNGRMLFAFLGISLLLFTDQYAKSVHRPLYFPLFLFISLWLCSVSTGALMVAYVLTAFWIVVIYQPVDRPFMSRIYVSLPLIFCVPFFIGSILKNMNYFGGGVSSLYVALTHGFGVYGLHYFSIPGLLLLMVLVMLSAYWLWQFLQKQPQLLFPVVTIITGSAVSLYGFSTIMTAFPGVIFLTYYYTLKLLDQKILSYRNDEVALDA